jgi:hypothetical protein
MDNWLNAKNKPNQTQFKPNAQDSPKPLYFCTLYKKTPIRRPKKQTQFKPNPKNQHKPIQNKDIHRKTAVERKKSKPKQTQKPERIRNILSHLTIMNLAGIYHNSPGTHITGGSSKRI